MPTSEANVKDLLQKLDAAVSDPAVQAAGGIEALDVDAQQKKKSAFCTLWKPLKAALEELKKISPWSGVTGMIVAWAIGQVLSWGDKTYEKHSCSTL